MITLVCTLGIPGSGKTTWAKEFLKENPEWVRVNRDDIRDMFSENYKFSKSIEDIITKAQLAIISDLLKSGINVICDDTNLNPNTQKKFQELCSSIGVNYKIQDFRSVPLSVCIERDSKRKRPVGATVIGHFFAKYISK